MKADRPVTVRSLPRVCPDGSWIHKRRLRPLGPISERNWGKQIRIQVSQQRTENKLFVLHNCTQWHLLMVGVVLPEILLGRIRRWPEGFIQNERLWCATRDEKLRRSGTYILLFFLFFFLVISNSISPNNKLKKESTRNRKTKNNRTGTMVVVVVNAEKLKAKKKKSCCASIFKDRPEGTTELRAGQLSSWYTYKHTHTHIHTAHSIIVCIAAAPTNTNGGAEKKKER